MEIEFTILNKLLDKYEERVPTSNRKVRIECSNCDISIPDIECSEYILFREKVLILKDKGFIDLDWVRKDYIIKSIWLDLNNVDAVYQYLGRENRKSKVSKVIKLIDDALIRIEVQWIRDYLFSARNYMNSNNKLTGVWTKEQVFLENLLLALTGISEIYGKSISMRAFSVKYYKDSKYFERELKMSVITIIKNYESDLKDINNDEINEREALAQVGIIMMSEIFEFCGNVRINYEGGTVDYSCIKNGACVTDESVSEIVSIDVFDTDKIIFIENKTNYTEYCLNCRNNRELVVYHGGFYSPKHGEFFRKLCDRKLIPSFLWSDIDYGGFKMFVRLKKNIVPELKPMNMDIDSLNKYKENGLKRDDKYLLALQKLTEDSEYIMFRDVIEEIVKLRVTVEQESFL